MDILLWKKNWKIRMIRNGQGSIVRLIDVIADSRTRREICTLARIFDMRKGDIPSFFL